MEYFSLCQTSLQVPRVQQFLRMEEDGSRPILFMDLFSCSSRGGKGGTTPQTRLKYIQRLLAQGIGWDPDFLTTKLHTIFVEQKATTTTQDRHRPFDHDAVLVADIEIQELFQHTVTSMQTAISDAMMSKKSTIN